MKKEYIRPEEMRELFTLVPLLKNIKISLDSDLRRLTDYEKDSDNDYIEGLTFSNGNRGIELQASNKERS